MKIILINNELEFIPLTKQLRLATEKNNPVILSASASLCLEELIAYAGKTVERDRLLAVAWSGLVVTPNNLNQSIVSLRKALKSLKIEQEIILTSPKAGYRLSANTTIEYQEVMAVPDDRAVSIEPDAGEPGNLSACAALPTVTTGSRVKNGLIRHWKLAAYAIFISIIFSITFLHFYFSLPTVNYVLQQKNAGKHIYFQKELAEAPTRVYQAVKLLQEDADLKQIVQNKNYIYINKTIKESIFSYFLCSQPITELSNACNSFIIVGKTPHE